MYIHKASSISFQPVFNRDNFFQDLEELNEESKIIHPDYKSFIPPMSLRRMTDFIKMTVANGFICANSLNDEEVGGIIIGTAIGGSAHTNKFMYIVAHYEGGLVSPTSFILSTHNTAAGQLSLFLKCNGYNNTHVQNSLSFEHGLIDAILRLEEDNKNIIVGAVDESDNRLFDTEEKIGLKGYPVAYGSSLFLINSIPKEGSVRIKDAQTHYKYFDFGACIKDFLEVNECAVNNIDYVLYSSRNDETIKNLKELFGSDNIENFEKYTGSYLTSSSFATHIAFDLLSHSKKYKNVLVVNNLLENNLGLILLIK